MTYIIAGQLNNLKFLMSDCIATDNTKTPKRYTFAEETKKLLSDPNTRFALAGVGNVAHYIEFYDYWLYSQGQESNFINDSESLGRLIKFIVLANQRSQFRRKLEDNRIFFLTKEGVFFCQLTFNNNDTLKAMPVIHKVENNSYIDSYFGYTTVDIGEQAKAITGDNIRDYCLQHLHHLARLNGEKTDLFASRIQFTVLDDSDELINESPFKYPSDILSMYFDKDFQDLDNPEFRFTV